MRVVSSVGHFIKFQITPHACLPSLFLELAAPTCLVYTEWWVAYCTDIKSHYETVLLDSWIAYCRSIYQQTFKLHLQPHLLKAYSVDHMFPSSCVILYIILLHSSRCYRATFTNAFLWLLCLIFHNAKMFKKKTVWFDSGLQNSFVWCHMARLFLCQYCSNVRTVCHCVK